MTTTPQRPGTADAEPPDPAAPAPHTAERTDRADRADRTDRDVRLPQQHTAGQHQAAEEHGAAGDRGSAEEHQAAGAHPETLPEDHPAEPDPRPMRDLPRWVRWTVLPLLVLVPLGYVIISAEQSRDGGVSKQQEAAARNMTWEEPTSLQQRIYQVPFPVGATRVGYLETNSWDTSALYAQFTTTAGGLDTFLARIGTSRDALRDGRAALSPAQARTAGWSLSDAGPWVGTELHTVGDRPDHDIVVDLSDADAPTVYVVSTVNFQHGFGGG
jgi:hypothetical protein